MSAFDWTDTIVATATPPGIGLQAIVRVAGPTTWSVVDSLLIPGLEISRQSRRLQSARIRLDAWGREIEATLYTWPEGQSSTGQAACEFHLVSSPPLVDAVQAALISAGARLARPGEFTLRAFLSGRLDLVQAEGVLGLIEAEDIDVLKDAMDQRTGGLSRPIGRIRNALLDLLADIEASLDFAHEDIELIAPDAIAMRMQTARHEMDELLARLESRTLQTASRRVVLLGPPNAGKSSLFNALLGRVRSLTSSAAGTTRDVVVAAVQFGQHFVDLVDTAGVACSDSWIQQEAERLRVSELRRADLVLLCVPPQDSSAEDFRDNVLVVRTKRDLLSDWESSNSVAVSIHEPESIDALARVIQSRLESAGSNDSIRSTTIRVRAALGEAAEAMDAAKEAHNESLGEEVVADRLREAIGHLGEVIGEVYTEDLLDRVFSRFCIGK